MHTLRNSVRAGERLGPPVGSAPQGIAGVGAVLTDRQCRGLVLPYPGTRCPWMRRAEPLAQEIEGALMMPGSRADGCFVSRAGVSLSAGCARLTRHRGGAEAGAAGPVLGTLEGGGR